MPSRRIFCLQFFPRVNSLKKFQMLAVKPPKTPVKNNKQFYSYATFLVQLPAEIILIQGDSCDGNDNHFTQNLQICYYLILDWPSSVIFLFQITLPFGMRAQKQACAIQGKRGGYVIDQDALNFPIFSILFHREKLSFLEMMYR